MKKKKTTQVSYKKLMKAERMTAVSYVRMSDTLKEQFETISKKKKMKPTIRIRKMVEADVEKNKHLL